ASENGHCGVVKPLLAREDVNLNKPDPDLGLAPLCGGAEKGHDGVVNTLLSREDVNPNTLDTEYGRTPPCWVPRNGYELVVKTLLVREHVRTDSPYSLNKAPVSWPLSGGHNQIVNMLQE
ncbi:hypothetical protein L873DRAFT_1652783, partial [Choiromyces venosus 120613-1]